MSRLLPAGGWRMVNGSRSVEFGGQVASDVEDAQDQNVRFGRLVDYDVLPSQETPDTLADVAAH